MSILSDFTCIVPKHNVLLVIGNCKAHLGPEDALYTFDDRTKNNEKLLINYSLEGDLIIPNTRFQKKGGKLFNFMSKMNNCKSQIDYYITKQKMEKQPYKLLSILKFCKCWVRPPWVRPPCIKCNT